MAERKTESIRPGITSSSSHLASMYGNDFVELVWQNGQILVQGGSSSRTLKRPSCIGYSINPSQETHDEDPCITKRARFNTLYSLLDSSHQNSRQTNDRCFYPFNSKYAESNSFTNKPGDEFSNLRPERESNSKSTGGNTQLCSPSSQSQKHDLGSDQRLGKINFSNFLRPALFFKSTCLGNSATQHSNSAVLARVEEFKATDRGISRALDHSVVIDPAKGSHSLNGDHPDQTAFTCNKANPTAPIIDAKKEQEILPDEHSEAVGVDKALKTRGSQHGQYRNQAQRVEGKSVAEFSGEPLVASSSLYSLGASNDLTLGRKHEDTDDSTYTSDNDEETEDTIKETPTQDGSRGKRRRNTQMHNLSERKRRDEINKKLRALKELIPNCSKMDKASMLDDAIDYVKNLKLQLEVLSMGSGGCMPVMMWMLAAGMRPGIGIPCSSLPPTPSILPQVAPIPNNTNTTLHQMLAAGFNFPNPMQMLPIINPFPISPSHAPFIHSMPPPKPSNPPPPSPLNLSS